MKQIIKSEPKEFTRFVVKNNPKTWNNLSKKIGNQLRVYMLENEQNFQCAYTEIHINTDGLESHIDHFQKQSLYPKLIFEWTNLFVACNCEYYGAKFKDKIIKEVDYQYVINPAKINPANHFNYSVTGEILSKDDFGKTTIDLFNLNDKSLVEQRNTVAKQIKLLHNIFDADELVNHFQKFESFIREIYKSFQSTENE